MVVPLKSHTVTIKRLTQSVVSGKRSVSESTIASNVDCYIQPQVETHAESVVGVAPSQDFFAYFAMGTDLLDRDEVTDGTTVWRVKNVRDFDMFNAPMQCVLEEVES